MRLFTVFTLLFFLTNFSLFGAEVQRNYRYEGASIVPGSTLSIEDEDFALLSTGGFVDTKMFGYVRLGINDRVNIPKGEASKITVEFIINRYDQNGNPTGGAFKTLEVDYNLDNDGDVYLDLSDYREDFSYKFDVYISYFYITTGGVTSYPSELPEYVYLETGYYAERYYELDVATVPAIGVQYIEYDSNGEISLVSAGPATGLNTQEIIFNWDYVYGAEYYELEWTWVDNYSNSGGIELSANAINFSIQDFKNNCTRIRTSDQSYSIPQVFAKGYLIYRVRAVGKWLDETDKEKYGRWSSLDNLIPNIYQKVSNWSHYIKISSEHEQLKNWQYQATYAEEGKKKEVVQYFDGSLRGRQTVTRINSNKQSVVGETVYDNEGRGVVQILPTPQNEPVLRYYEGVNLSTNSTDAAYSHEDFDWETSPACSVEVSEVLKETSGAGQYYSTTGLASDKDWQQYVPESDGYAFTQVEYTPDNTGRIRRQSGVGDVHKIGSGHETEYYYSQPTQEELNRLFGYKVGHMSRYKKNMVVDANGQVSISYLDAQGRVVATAMAGDNQTPFDGLESETTTTYHNTMKSDILNKLESTDEDTPADNNDLISTSRFENHEDALIVNTQLAVVQDDTDYDFTYSISTHEYEDPCGEFDYPFVYDLDISLLSDCGEDQLVAIGTPPDPLNPHNYLGISSTISPFTSPLAIDADDLAKGTYTLSKELKVNETALNEYLIDYLSTANTCLLTLEDFTVELEDCGILTCQECEDAIGEEESFTTALIAEDPSITSTEAENIYNQLLEDCWEPCRPALFCDVYKGMLLADVSPGGQYASTDGADPISPYATGAWRSKFNGTSENYLDQYGNVALIEAYPPSSGTVDYQLQNNGGTLELVEPWQLRREDFIAAFQESWAEGLLEFHPEYLLYLYAEDLCTVEDDVPTSGVSIALSSEEFDAILRNEIRTYADAAGGNSYGIEFLTDTEADAIYDIDPFFTETYPKHNPINGLSYHALKNELMETAMSNYLNSGYSMLEYAFLTNIHGNNTSPPSSGALDDEWDNIISNNSLTTTESDALWQTYLSYYLSYKGMINQYLMDMYGFDNGLYNGCIGDGNYAPGVLFAFRANGAATTNPGLSPPPYGFLLMYQRTISLLMDDVINPPLKDWFTIAIGYDGTSEPTLCAEYFNDKQLRINRMEAGTNPSVSTSQTLQELSEDADYTIWEQTGLCPLALDMERLLNGMGTRGDLLGTGLHLQDIPEFVPDLYQAFTTNPLPMSIGADLEISGAVVSGELHLEIEDASSPFTSYCTIEIPQLTNANGSLSWSNYNTGGTPWYIFSVGSSYPVSSTEMKVVIRAGFNLSTPDVFEEYVVTYTTSCSLDLDACQDIYSMDNSFDPDCKKEEQFEAAILCLLQTLIVEEEFEDTDVELDGSAYDACFTNSILFDYFGAGATWSNNGMGGVIIESLDGTTSFGFPLPDLYGEDVVMFNSINLFSPSGYTGSIHYNALIGGVDAEDELTNIIAETETYEYESGGLYVLPIDFSCTCEEMLSEEDQIIAREVVADAFFDMLTYLYENSGSYTPGMTSDEIVNFASYLYCEDCEGIYDLSVGEGTVSFELREYGSTTGSGCTIELDFESIEYDAIYSVEIAPDNTFVVTTVKYGTGIGDDPKETFDVMTGELTCLSFEWFCERKCKVSPPVPLSCTDEYAQYLDQMETFDHMTTDETEFLENYVVDELDFCNSSFAYISDAYIAYLSGLSITDISDVQYLSIASFGNTPLGYSYGHLDGAVIIYLYETDYSDPASPDYLTWHEFVANIYLRNLENETGKYCPPKVPAIYTNDLVPAPDPCEWESNVLAQNAATQYQIYLDQVAKIFVQSYISQAMSTVVETFEESHLDKEYHYTLYYYDRAGNLIQTVPPKGVDRLQYDNGVPMSGALKNTGTAALNSDINSYRKDEPEATALTDGGISGQLAPEHTLETIYRYNSLNQLVYQKTPDGGESKFAYDALGRLVLSQNAKQKLVDQYSYTKYDELGRVVEVGELTLTDPGASFYYQISDEGVFMELYTPPFGPIEHIPYWGVNASTFPNDLSNVREEVTRTIYDELDGITVDLTNGSVYTTLPVVNVMGTSYQGDNTRNRIVAVLYEDVYDSLEINNYDNATFYDYDVHGNVKHLLQVNNAYMLKQKNQHIKHFDYEYDLVSGNVLKVIYQKGYTDQYIHRYYYDADNRITIAETSKDGVIYEKDAKYFYYDHGPLARTEIGEKKVQALDYAYTIQGWLKSVNGEKLSEQTMMGNDGEIATQNSQNGRDAFGFSLSYFDNDYEAANMEMLDFSPVNSGGNSELGAGLYNGNIRTMYTVLSDEDQAPLAIGTHQTNYLYDQLNRIKSMAGFDRVGATAMASTSKYSSSYSYDENGNLMNLVRYADLAGTSTEMDNFTYKYEDPTNSGYNNRLSWVDDIAGSSDFEDVDIDNSMDAYNYTYDSIGQLISDVDEGISEIHWKVTNKVDKIVYDDDRIIEFDYDAMGNRIAKHVIESLDTTSTFYTLDAQGNTMSIYNYSSDDQEVALVERNIYGSSRLGIETLDQEMALEDLNVNGYFDVGLLTHATGSSGTCTSAGVFYPADGPKFDFEIADVNSDGSNELIFNNNLTPTNTPYFPGASFASIFIYQITINTIPGQTYEMTFDVLAPHSGSTTYVYTINCPTAGLINTSTFNSAGSKSISFTAVDNLSRIKFWNTGSGSTYQEVILSNFNIDGPGDVFGLNTPSIPENYTATNEVGDKRYELSNHLGNVLEVVTDRKLEGTTDVLVTDVEEFKDEFNNSSTLGWYYEPEVHVGAPAAPSGYSLASTGGNLVFNTGTAVSNATKQYFLEDGVEYTINFDLDVLSSGTLTYVIADPVNGTLGADVASSTGSYSLTVEGEGETSGVVFISSTGGVTIELDNIELIRHVETETIESYTADVIQYSDYYPFGMIMPGRKFSGSDKHSYGFQGQLLDDEIKGENNSVNYTFRMHDPRVGRFFAVDPLASKYPKWSPYIFSGNQVIHTSELEGLEPEFDATDNPRKSLPAENKKTGEWSQWVSAPKGNGTYSWAETAILNDDGTVKSDNPIEYYRGVESIEQMQQTLANNDKYMRSNSDNLGAGASFDTDAKMNLYSSLNSSPKKGKSPQEKVEDEIWNSGFWNWVAYKGNQANQRYEGSQGLENFARDGLVVVNSAGQLAYFVPGGQTAGFLMMGFADLGETAFDIHDYGLKQGLANGGVRWVAGKLGGRVVPQQFAGSQIYKVGYKGGVESITEMGENEATDYLNSFYK